ncbi:MAG: protein TolQ, partial [Desulfuromonadales bacterium]|nr:protein TolQ [Desulfuromonadales bacterium]NIS40355.1 protein TolQ [Desulfuromonadales bacterium]
MSEPLSIWELIVNASLVVQLVMGLLFLASMTSWVMIFQRGFMLTAVRREATEFENEFWSGKDLRKIFQEMNESEAEPIGMENIFAAGFREFSRLRKQEGADPDRVMQNVHRAMRVAMAREEERLEANLPFLATVGSTSPYIGLFGTVWGIMNSFRGLATVNQASLSIVAPGISEALVATAMG